MQTLRELEPIYLESFEMQWWRRMKRVKWSDKVTNEVLERIREKKTYLNNILSRKFNCVGNILGRNCLLHDATGQMTKMNGVGRSIT